MLLDKAFHVRLDLVGSSTEKCRFGSWKLRRWTK